MKTSKISGFLIFAFFLFATFLSGNELNIYVSTKGSNMARGSIDDPIRDLRRALEIAEADSAKNITIYLDNGIYRLQSALIHTVKHWGNSRSLKYTSLPNMKATISGSLLIQDLKWLKHKGKIFKAKLDVDIAVHDLYINGEKQILARYPNYDANIRHFNGYATDAISKEKVKQWKNPQGAIVHAMHKAEWGGYQYVVKSKNEEGELELEGGFQNNRPTGMHTNYRMIENVFEELDSPGEWYYSKSEKSLYFYPREDMDMAHLTLEIPQVESLFEFVGDKDNRLSNIAIENLNLTHTQSTYMRTDEPLLRSDWKIYRGGAIFFSNVENSVVSQCDFSELGGNAIFVSGYARAIDINRNHIYNIGGNAISFVGSPNAVRSPSLSYGSHVPYPKLDLVRGPKTDEYPTRCVADNNLIHDIGRIEKQVAGVQISMASHIQVSYNSIYNLPRAGINVSEGTWGGHLIKGNDVFNTVLETGDHGSFNSWGRDRFWIANRNAMNKLVNEHPELILKDANYTTTICNNRWQCFHGWDIDLDDGSSNYHIYNNLCLNGGLKLREGFYRTVENNVIVNNSFHPHVWFENSKDIFRHNVVARDYFPIAVNFWGDQIDYNLFPDALSLKKAQSRGTDKHSLYASFDFVDASNGDFRIKEIPELSKIGFVNFVMNSFGVQYAPLKAIAQQPQFPKPEFLNLDNTLNKASVMQWLGASLKTITTEGERSATGIDKVQGIIITKLDETSLLKELGLEVNTVIVELGGKLVSNCENFQEELKAYENKSNLKLGIVQNQAYRLITINF